MFAALALTLLASSVAALPQSSDIQPATPAALVQCQPILFSWQGGKAPYYVSLIPGRGNPSAAAVVDFGKLDENQKTWIVTQPVDTDLTLKIVDSEGKSQFSAPVTVQKGSSDSCLTASSGAGSSGAAETGATDGSAETGAPTDGAAPSESAPVNGAADAASTPAANTGAASATDAPTGAATGASTGATGSATGASTGAASTGAVSSVKPSASGSASGTASGAPASSPTSGAGRLIASTGLVAAVVAAVAFF